MPVVSLVPIIFKTYTKSDIMHVAPLVLIIIKMYTKSDTMPVVTFVTNHFQNLYLVWYNACGILGTNHFQNLY